MFSASIRISRVLRNLCLTQKGSYAIINYRRVVKITEEYDIWMRVMKKTFKSSNFRSFSVLCVVLLSLVALPISSAYGLVVGSTDTSDFSNGSAWDGMNWDYVYQTSAGTSVAIDGWHLVTPGHYYPSIGTTFSAGTETFEIISKTPLAYDIGQTNRPDMQVFEVQNNTTPGVPLPGSYKMYSGTVALNQEMALVGTGHTGYNHGSSYSDDTSSPRLKRWGTNRVEPFGIGQIVTARKTYSNWSTMAFRMDYNSGYTDHEVGIADHDSGAGVFVLDNGEWKLAGIGLYRESTGVTGRYHENFFASIPDYRDQLLDFLPEFVLGDANGDGLVTAGDYAAVQMYFGNAGGPGLRGDADGNGVVSAGDYACVQSNFGNTAGSSSIVEASQVPEPTTLSLLGLGAIAALRRRRK